ncbi:DUF6884 domain-containing protein [Streptomyces sp. NPDC051644]|uniref:DUF6884 domain-containing protein n=1 Tax=Streptomyces sp. NPDC051644 TaxID=3365666 RepID=UPI0037BDC4A0
MIWGLRYRFLWPGAQESWNPRAFSCGARKLDPQPADHPQPVPAGKLYIGYYHRSLRSAADALTSGPHQILMLALHGLVTLNTPLVPYEMTMGNPLSVTSGRLRLQADAYGLHSADVIFLGGKRYAHRLLPAVPHCLRPLTGGMESERGQCRAVAEQPELRRQWWDAAELLLAQRRLPG